MGNLSLWRTKPKDSGDRRKTNTGSIKKEKSEKIIGL
jgi:hypothetical protein